jgi:hypothetical protein
MSIILKSHKVAKVSSLQALYVPSRGEDLDGSTIAQVFQAAKGSRGVIVANLGAYLTHYTYTAHYTKQI